MKDKFSQFLVDPDFVFQALVSGSNDYIYMWNYKDDSYIVSPNLAEDFAIDLTGDNFKETWQNFIYARDLERVNDTINEVLAEKKTKFKIEYQVITMRGSYLWLDDNAVVHYNKENGEPELIIGMMHNLSFDGEVDAVTGLLLHNKCKEVFDLMQMSKLESMGSLMLLGIDGFANINTLNSHAFGDLVLRTTVQTILNLLPEGISMYRYDGDQLLMIGEKISKQELIVLYNNIKEYSSSSHMIQDKNYRFTVSAGIASYPEDGYTWVDLEKAVSIALKQAKEAGKNQCVEVTKEMLSEKLYEQSLGGHLSESIEANFNGFKVVFQPVCYAQTLKVKGAEILLRYITPDGQFINPDQFIPLLEQSQLIIPVGIWVLEQAIKACKKWLNYIEDFVMNVNVSYIQLRDPSFCDKVEALLAQYNLDVKHLTLELTESYFITDAPNINVSMERLRELHLQVAMDDFGTGYSSLARLSQFNVDVVKIDRSFVQSLHNSKYNRDFVDSVVRLCHNVGMKVCVEGVETREEQESICLLNTDFIQGFYVSRPVEEDVFFTSFVVNPTINDSLVVVPNMQLRHDQLIGDKDVLMAMMDATPLGLNFWNRNYEIIACNVAVLHLFEAKNFKDFKENFFQFSPLYQSDGSRSEEKATRIILEAFSGHEVKVFWDHIKRDGEVIPTEVTLVRIPYMNDYIVASYTRDMREQRMMEAKIEKFNNRLRAILDANPLCLNLWNNKYENMMCNKAAVDLFELNDEQEYLDKFFQLSPLYQPDGRLSSEKAIECIEEAFAKGIKQFEWMHQKLNGEQIPAEITLIKIDELDENEGTLIAGYTRDMREQRDMEDKINKFNIRLKAVLDASPLCLNLWNNKFENSMCNKAAVDLFDLKNEQEYMDRFFELSPVYQPDGILSSVKSIEYITEAFKTGRKQFEWMHCKLDGEEIPAEITLIKIDNLDEDGGDLVAGFTRDMRAQIETQKLQDMANMRIQAVLDASPIACFLWTIDFKLVDCNEVAVSMFGVNDKSEIIDNFNQFMPLTQPNGENSLYKKDNKFLELLQKGYLSFEWVYINKKKEEVPCEVTLVKIALEKEDIIVSYSRDLRELQHTLELNNRLSKMAYYDVLTGVTSRARFVEKLENDFSSLSSKQQFALVIFDIDYFKTVNDTHGHEAGDIVLKRIAKSVEKRLPSNATMGRFGGDEFIIEIENITPAELEKVMSLLVDDIADIEFNYEGSPFTTSISIGASFKSLADEDYHQLLNRADKALYEAKTKGRNCYAIIKP